MGSNLKDDGGSAGINVAANEPAVMTTKRMKANVSIGIWRIIDRGSRIHPVCGRCLNDDTFPNPHSEVRNPQYFRFLSYNRPRVSRFINSSVLRLLDANANRAREALRVLEDYARFVRDDAELSEQLKVLRHDFTGIVAPFLPAAIVHRDTVGDVGTTISTSAEGKRAGVEEVVVAAGKRLGEAVRAIEEYLKTLDVAFLDDHTSRGCKSPDGLAQDKAPGIHIPGSYGASAIEQLRYRFYTIEQRIARTFASAAQQRMGTVRLYVLITESICKRPWLEAAEQAIAGGADCLQLREKELEGGEFLNRAKQFVALCRAKNVISIINDRPDIAALTDADGVHVGQGDLSVKDVRSLLGSGKIVGVSTHNIAQSRQAERDGADYIGVGPVFPSGTKPRDFLPGLAFAKQVADEIKIPAVAIAGITRENVGQVIAVGIKTVAVTAAVVGREDVAAAAREMREAVVQDEVS